MTLEIMEKLEGFLDKLDSSDGRLIQHDYNRRQIVLTTRVDGKYENTASPTEEELGTEEFRKLSYYLLSVEVVYGTGFNYFAG